ncbi:MAG: hypothetical protein MK209_06365 [Planctomycetes bacterium]|nr:hypothetical protein [Planctomycetota bacterium]
MIISTLCTLLLASLAPTQDWKSLADELRRTQDGYEASIASEAFAKVRDPEAMEARVELYAEKMNIRGGVHLRDWLYSGMMRAESDEELGPLLDAAADRKADTLLRLTCLRALRRGEASAPASALLDNNFRKLKPELQREWQNTVGSLLAQRRIIFDRKTSSEDVREALLSSGMPYLGYRWLTPNKTEVASMRLAAAKSRSAADRSQFLHVLAPHVRRSSSARSLWLNRLEQAVASEHSSERVAAWQSALDGMGFECIPHLIHGLTRANEEMPSRHLADYAEALRLLTDKQWGHTPERWQRWWTEEGQDWLAQATQSKSLPGYSKSRENDDTVAIYFGIPLDSHRVGFVLDGSGSMNDKLKDGRRCADAAMDEFESFLARYPDSATMQLRIIVRESMGPFDEAVSANKKNRKKAIDYLRRFDFGPSSAMYDVLCEAQLDPGIDTLVFVSDGGGSWGSYAYPPHMLDGLRLTYERSGVRIHTVCVGKSANKARFMEQLAEMTSGKMVKI